MFFGTTVIGGDLPVPDTVLFKRNLCSSSGYEYTVDLERNRDIGHHATRQSVHPPVNIFMWYSGKRRFYGLKKPFH